MGFYEEQFEGIKDRYGEKLSIPGEHPTLRQSICAWGLLNELVEIGYPHNFQAERSDIKYYMYSVSALIDKALKIQEVKE